MNSVSNNSALNNLYWEEKPKVQDRNNGALTQADFFALLTQQLAYQDPTKPVENDQMIAQMTNFTTADGIGKLNENFSNLAQSMTSNQALQASSLVGRSVLTQSNQIVFTGDSLARGVIDLERPASSLRVMVENEKGELIQSFSVENPKMGRNSFIWDGTYLPSGESSADRIDGELSERVRAGTYRLKVEASYSDGTRASIPANVYTPVGSVSMNTNGKGIMLNLLGLGAVKLGDVLEVSYG
ncbi:flagellar hook assembly protein FlgD [Alishewanella sp. HH-ZS]|jgi:flagellar basal-body rod modification protein FlgD|uniref:flagellar hook assembly protein FlgD n=1 Tax=Alishewanella sp. HH-ZS TaxID=1856684 RepID=UPI0008236FA2|nr:flagellar hook assembly protein FlgD [Alishewanella sp. HH-ZS]OCW98210.1 flagellar biosynthesis protein FlgD [Alishewanella sp. HH-ZS]